MFYSKMTKQEKDDAFRKANFAKRKLDNHTTVIAWKQFLQLSYAEQMRIREEWEVYYKEVAQSPIAVMTMDANKALKKNNRVLAQDLLKQIKQMRKNGDAIIIKKPTSPEPAEFDYGDVVMAYKNCDRTIKELSGYPNTEEIEAAKKVW